MPFLVPNFKHNLLYVNQIVRDTNISVRFTKSHYYPQGLWTKRLLVTKWMDKCLYKLLLSSFSENKDPSTILSFNYCNVCIIDISPALWHSRLGRTSESKLVYITDINYSLIKSLCEVCPLAKHKRLSFPKNSTTAKKFFYLLHMDLWGPYRVKFIQGTSYFLTVVDDHIRTTWTFLFIDKTQVSNIILTLLNLIQNLFYTFVKFIRYDNNSIFINSKCGHLFKKRGIIHQKTCPYSPQ